MRKSSIAFLLVALSTSSAFAADLGPYPRGSVKDRAPAYYPSPAFNWSGFYLGVQAGYGWGTTDAQTGSLSTFNQAYSYDTDGAIGGVHAGFNWQTQNIVLGVETDIEASGIEATGTGTLGSLHTTSLDWLGSFRGRVGIASDRTLFYLTGGLAYADLTTAGPGLSSSDWRTGWTLGGGIEHAFTPNMTARIEYRHTDLGSSSFGSSGVNRAETNDISFGAVRAGLSWRF